VFRDLPRLSDPAAFSPWLYRIARNRAFRALRGREPMAPIENHDVAGNDTDDADFTAEDGQAVHAALDQLAAEQREVLLLRFIEDMSYDEIAEVIDCPIGTVRSRLHNAKRALRRILQPRDTGEKS